MIVGIYVFVCVFPPKHLMKHSILRWSDSAVESSLVLETSS